MGVRDNRERPWLIRDEGKRRQIHGEEEMERGGGIM